MKIIAGSHTFSYADKTLLSEYEVAVPENTEQILELCATYSLEG